MAKNSGNSVGNNQKAGNGGNKNNTPNQGVGNNKSTGAKSGIGNNQPAKGGNNGAATQTAPTETYNPGVENPTPEPFLTQQDIEEYAEAREQYESGLHQLDENYSSKQHENEYEEHEIEKNRVGAVEGTNWDAASRGLFKSSIRDGDLADIDATAEIKKTFLSDSLKALAVYNEGQKTAMAAKWGRYEEAEHRKEVENAEGVAANMPKWSVEPHMESTPAPPPQAKVDTNIKKPKSTVIANDPIGGKQGNGRSANGGTTAPPPNPSVSNNQKPNANHVAVANNQIAGKIYGK